MQVYVGDAVRESDVGLPVEEGERPCDVALVAEGYVARLGLGLLQQYPVEVGERRSRAVFGMPCVRRLDAARDDGLDRKSVV